MSNLHKGRMKGDDSGIDTSQTPKLLDRRLALVEKIRKTFTASIPNKSTKKYIPLRAAHPLVPSLCKNPPYQRLKIFLLDDSQTYGLKGKEILAKLLEILVSKLLKYI